MQSIGAPISNSGLNTILADLDLTCLDVGARGGFSTDLFPISGSVSAVGFEPDRAECERLNREAALGGHPWRSLRFLPVALGVERGSAQLHLYRHRGCSSILEADAELAALFSRENYYILDETIPVPVVPLDEAAVEYGIQDAEFLKIDVQGGELDILSASRTLLQSSLLALRLEVSFVPMYKGQPLFSDIDLFVRDFGFVPMGFPEMHHWRRTTRVKHPWRAPGPLPYSRGQLVHGDVIYFRHPEAMPSESDAQIRALLKAAFIAISYDYIDHAAAIFRRDRVNQWLGDRYGIDPLEALSRLSSMRARIAGPGVIESLTQQKNRVLARLGRTRK